MPHNFPDNVDLFYRSRRHRQLKQQSTLGNFLTRIGQDCREPSQQELLWIAFAYYAAILTVCIPEIMLSTSLYLDDFHRYTLGVENKLHPTIIERNFFRAYAVFPLYKLLSIDVGLARLALVSVYLIPLSILTYYLLRKHCRTPASIAFFTALLPTILPGQQQIPFFIDGSYTVPGLLVFLMWLWSACTIVITDRVRPLLSIGSFVLLVVALGMMDLAFFLLPFATLLLLILGWKTDRRRAIIIVAVVCTIGALILLEKVLAGGTSPVEVPTIPNLDLFLRRASSFAHSTLPFSFYPASNHQANAIAALSLLILATAAVAIAPRKNAIPIAMGALWVVCAAVVFLTISRYYSPRYTQIASFGVAFILVYSSHALFTASSILKRTKIVVWVALAASLTLGAATYRFSNMVKYVTPRNATFDSIVHYLFTHEFVRDAQIAIVDGHRIPTGGYWVYSSGFLRMATERQDLSGIVGIEKGFYDPFDSSKRGFQQSHKMNGLDLEEPIYLFRQVCEKKCRLEQKSLALRWIDNEHWQLISFNVDDGSSRIAATGVGIDEFNSVRIAQDLSTEDIVFAIGSP